VIFLETQRLRLRAFETEDAARLSEYRSDENVARYQSWDAMTLEEAEAFIRGLPPRCLAAAEEWGQIALADRRTGELLGDIGLCRHADDVVELGFTLAPAAQGHGLALEACRAVVEWVLSFPDVEGVKAIVDTRNTAAIALVKRLGMAFDHDETAEFKGAPCTESHFILRR
jgi:aminoglycoside 6'-N-acetyltransferase